MAVTLAQLRTQFYNRFDEGQQNYILPAEANTLINEGAAHLHNWLVTEAEYYIWKEYSLPTVAGQSDYAMPSDFFTLLKLFGPAYGPAMPGVPAWTPMRRIMPQEYKGGAMGAFQGPIPFWPYGYMMLGTTLRIIPTPQKAYNLLMWYAPQWQDLVNDADLLEIADAPGWQEFVVNQAVIAARIKEESDTTPLERRQQQIMSLIQMSMINRDMGQHSRVVDVTGM
jgi:hypothetical protein